MPAIDPSTLPITSDLAKRLHAHVNYLASPLLKGRKPGTPENTVAADYIAEIFKHSGLEPLSSLEGYRQPITVDIGDNIIGVRYPQTTQTSDRWILLGAHFDHLGAAGGKIFAGADDNTAAVAILLEIALSLPSLTHHSLLFAAFNSEEPPYALTPLMGSQYFLDHLPREIRTPEHFQTVIVMDLIGGVYWPPLKNILFAAGAEHSPGLYHHLKALRSSSMGNDCQVKPIGLHTIEEIPLIGRRPVSDYDAFRNVSVPFLFLSAGRTPRYHRPSDKPSTLHYERMAFTTWWIQDLIRRIDEDHHPYTFLPNHLELSDEMETFRPLIQQAAGWKTHIPRTSPASLLKLKLDAKWLTKLDPAKAGPSDIKRLERAALRMQCLLADFPGGFLL